MRSRDRRLNLYRLLVSGLAVTGLLGHGIAMLLVALLAPAAAEAGQPPYGAICTAEGLIAAATAPARDDDRPPRPGGQLDACPVCTAYAQSGPADLPAPVALPCATSPFGALRAVGDAARPTEAGFAPPSRAPPAFA